jgi:hypothetical protein
MTPVHLFILLCYLCLMFISDIAACALGFGQHQSKSTVHTNTEEYLATSDSWSVSGAFSSNEHSPIILEIASMASCCAARCLSCFEGSLEMSMDIGNEMFECI